MTDLIEIYPENDLVIGIPLQSINLATGRESFYTSAENMSAYLVAGEDDVELPTAAIDPQLEIVPSYATATKEILLRWPKSVMTRARLSPLFGTPVRNGTIVKDGFTRPDHPSSLGNTDITFDPWIIDRGTWGITGGKAAFLSGVGGGEATLESLASNVKVGFTVTQVTESRILILRKVDANHTLAIEAWAGVIVLYTLPGADGLPFSPLAAAAYTQAIGDEWEVEANYTTITMRVNGEVLFKVTGVTDQLTGTLHGISSDIPTTFDDFYIETVAVRKPFAILEFPTGRIAVPCRYVPERRAEIAAA